MASSFALPWIQLTRKASGGGSQESRVVPSRSSGPGLFHADQATVTTATVTDTTALSFRLSTHSRTRPFIDVKLVVENRTMRALESGAEVSLRSQRDLEVPERAAAQTSR